MNDSRKLLNEFLALLAVLPVELKTNFEELLRLRVDPLDNSWHEEGQNVDGQQLCACNVKLNEEVIILHLTLALRETSKWGDCLAHARISLSEGLPPRFLSDTITVFKEAEDLTSLNYEGKDFNAHVGVLRKLIALGLFANHSSVIRFNQSSPFNYHGKMLLPNGKDIFTFGETLSKDLRNNFQEEIFNFVSSPWEDITLDDRPVPEDQWLSERTLVALSPYRGFKRSAAELILGVSAAGINAPFEATRKQRLEDLVKLTLVEIITPSANLLKGAGASYNVDAGCLIALSPGSLVEFKSLGLNPKLLYRPPVKLSFLEFETFVKMIELTNSHKSAPPSLSGPAEREAFTQDVILPAWESTQALSK